MKYTLDVISWPRLPLEQGQCFRLATEAAMNLMGIQLAIANINLPRRIAGSRHELEWQVRGFSLEVDDQSSKRPALMVCELRWNAAPKMGLD